MSDDRGEGTSGPGSAGVQSPPSPAIPGTGTVGNVPAREDGKGKAREDWTGRSDRERARRDTHLPNDMLEAMRELRFPAAAQPEIIRANQKDLYYLSELRDQVETVTRTVMGTRWLQHWSDEVREASRLAYFSLTTMLGSQTLGEEYCDIMQYSTRTGDFPSALRRTALVLAHVLLPYAFSKLYTRLRRRLTAIRESAAEAPNQVYATLARIEWPSFQSLVDHHLRAVHLAAFYLFGRYYHWAKRAAGVRYISTQTRRPGAQAQPPSYEVLGVLMTIQLLVRIVRALVQRRRRLIEEKAGATGGSQVSKKETQKQEREKNRKRATVDGVPVDQMIFDPDNPAPPAEEDDVPKFAWGEQPEGEAKEEGIQIDSHARRCTLCLGARRDPAATGCGHVFCWECIVGWAREKPECPLCRQALDFSAMLPVYNL